jgi:hypothetical protein
MRLLINKLLLFWVLMLTTVSVKAHNPNTTSVVISPVNGIYSVHYVISQEGANYALAEYYAGQDLQSLSSEEYKEKYIDYIKNHTRLLIDDKEIPLGSGGIKIGNHQTDIRFLLPNYPTDYKTVQVTIDVFKQNENQHTVVKFLEGEKSFRKVLNVKNGFSFQFENTTEGFVGKQDKKLMSFWHYAIPLFVILLLTLLVWKRRKTGGNNGYK